MNKGLVISFLTILVTVGIISFFVTNSKNSQSQNSDTGFSVVPTSSPSGTITTSSPVATVKGEEKVDQLKIEEIKVGAGAEAVSGKRVTVNYSGILTNGTKFDSSYDRGTPFSFNLGAGEVIQGWDIGVVGMKVGGKRKLTIPANLGYGAAGAGGVIPPNATLIFEVELLGVE